MFTKKPIIPSHPSTSTSPNILMKERPNISITPVTTATPAVSFVKPSTASPGKTLQEKLADKQKQQLNKQLNKNIEANIFAKNTPMTSTDVLMKSLNLPATLPSSLTVSKAQLANSSIYTMDPSSSKSLSASATSLYANELARKLPPSINVSKSLPTPSFPKESGISISQVINDWSFMYCLIFHLQCSFVLCFYFIKLHWKTCANSLISLCSTYETVFKSNHI